MTALLQALALAAWSAGVIPWTILHAPDVVRYLVAVLSRR